MDHTSENLHSLWKQVHLACEVGNFGGKAGAINLVKRQLKRIRARNGNEKTLLEWRCLLSGVYARYYTSLEGKLGRRRYLKKAIKIQEELEGEIEKFSPRMLYTRSRIFFLAKRSNVALMLTNLALTHEISTTLRAMLLVNAAEILTAVGEKRRAQDHFIEAYGLAESVKIEARIRVFRSFGEFLADRGDRMLALAYLECAEELARSKEAGLLFVEAGRIRALSKKIEDLTGAVRKIET